MSGRGRKKVGEGRFCVFCVFFFCPSFFRARSSRSETARLKAIADGEEVPGPRSRERQKRVLEEERELKDDLELFGDEGGAFCFRRRRRRG